MKNDNNVRQMKLTEITPVNTAPKKPHKALNAVLGIAGAAAVLTGAFFGLKFLNDHGGLKGPDAGGSGNMPNCKYNYYAADISQNVEKIDISELAGRTFTFSDMTAAVEYAGYDGHYIRLDVTESWSGEIGNSAFVLEPASYGGFLESSPTNGMYGFPSEDIDGNARKQIYIRQYPMAAGESFEFYPSSYSKNRNIERITDLIVTVSKERDTVIMQPIPSEKDSIGDGVRLTYLNVTPQILNLTVGFEDQFFIKDPVVSAISADGTLTALKGMNYNGEFTPEGLASFQYCYIPDDPQLDLSEMKAFEINGIIFEITAEPFVPMTTAIVTDVTMTRASDGAPEAGDDASADTTAPADPVEEEIRNVSDMLDADTAVRDAMLREKEALSSEIGYYRELLESYKREIEKLNEELGKLVSLEMSGEYARIMQSKSEYESKRQDTESKITALENKLVETENSISLYESKISELEEQLAELHRQITEG
ncbi:MAG: hypothetical protein IJT87_13120 [Ruminiclostridium sp.]|nr:hypothetical protein [Ruminiclostridium sp.]